VLKEERMKVLSMLQEGIITVEEAQKLLEAIDGNTQQVVNKKAPFRMLKINIDAEDGDEVKIQVPIEFAKLLKGKSFNANLNNHQLDIDEIIKMVENGAIGELVKIDSNGDKISIVVE